MGLCFGITKKSYARISETIPKALKDLQVNGCKNPACANFCIDPHDYDPAEYSLRKGSNPFYKISGAGRNEPNLQCRLCSEITPIKSNVGILEEESRISSYLREPSYTCPNTECKNHHISISDNPKLYKRHGQTSGNIGS